MGYYYFIGIGGIGMSGLAHMLLQQGHKVAGSDLCSSALVDVLAASGATIHIGHSPSHVPEEAIVIYTSQVKVDHPEYQAAIQKKCILLHRSLLLHTLMQKQRALLVAGSHGKTTTSALLSHVLLEAGNNPSYAVGGVVRGLQAQASLGSGPYFIAEADESDGSFLTYAPYGAIITNIGLDHLDYWQSASGLEAGFAGFMSKVKNRDLLFWGGDDSRLQKKAWDGVSYGFSEGVDLRIIHSVYEKQGVCFSLQNQQGIYADISLPLMGKHNIQNATAVFGLCLALGIEEETIRKAFLSFAGVGRRVEKKGEVGGICFYDDYAHHPTEIATTLAALKNMAGERRVVVVFQPHRFTRTRDCFDAFGPALSVADKIFITDIYAAQEEALPGIHSSVLVAHIQNQGCGACQYVPWEDVVEMVSGDLQSGDVVVSMGAGSITRVGPEMIKRLVRE